MLHKHMRILILVLTFFSILGCENQTSYELEEDKAIEDIINDYVTHYIGKTNRLPTQSRFDSALLQSDPIPENIQVYISDALIPISQLFEDNIWMTSENYQDSVLESEFSKLYNFSRLQKLHYREFDKKDLNLDAPLSQCVKCADEISADEQYSRISLSRICFNQQRDKGIVIINYGVGFESGIMGGHFGPFLIEKKQNKWTIIPK